MSAKQLQQEIAAAQRKLAKIRLNASPAAASNLSAANASGAKSKSSKRRARRNAGSSSNRISYIAPVVRSTNPKLVRNPKGIPSDGTIRVKRREFLAEVKGDELITVPMHPEKFSWLKSFCSMYDRYVMHSLTVYYKSASGTQQSGMLMMGADWDQTGWTDIKPESRLKHISSMQPVYEGPVWQSGSMSFPSRKLMAKKTYLTDYDLSKDVTKDYSEQRLSVYLIGYCSGTKGQSFGHLWAEVDLSFQGPQLTE